jgi:hypothetical protein
MMPPVGPPNLRERLLTFGFSRREFAIILGSIALFGAWVSLTIVYVFAPPTEPVLPYNPDCYLTVFPGERKPYVVSRTPECREVMWSYEAYVELPRLYKTKE